jgi:hypothetical protein
MHRLNNAERKEPQADSIDTEEYGRPQQQQTLPMRKPEECP